MQYLGHIISKEGIRADTSKLRNFTFPTIRRKKDKQRVTGLLNWFRPFVKHFNSGLAPVYDKLAEEHNTWTEEDQSRVQMIFLDILR